MTIITISGAPHGSGIIKKIEESMPKKPVIIRSGLMDRQELGVLERRFKEDILIFTEFEKASDYLIHWVINQQR